MSTVQKYSIYISLPHYGVKQVHCTEDTTIKSIIKNALGQISLSDYTKLFELEANSSANGLITTLYVEMTIKEVVDKLGTKWLNNYRLFLKMRHLSLELYDSFKNRNIQMLEILYFQCLEEILKDPSCCDHEQFLRFLTLEIKRRFLQQNGITRLKNYWISKQLHSLASAKKISPKYIKSEFIKLKAQTSPKICITEFLHLHRCIIGLIYKKFNCFLKLSDDLMVVELIMRSLDGISYRISDQSWRMLCGSFSSTDGIKNAEMQRLDEGKGRIVITMASSTTEFYGAFSVMEEILYYLDRSCSVNGVTFTSSSPSDPAKNSINSSIPQIIASLSDMIIDTTEVDIRETIGEGQFGSVYRGVLNTSSHFTKEVAVKIHRGTNADILNSFYGEADLMRKFHHPNVISFFGILKGTPAIVMELALFGELRTYLQKDKSISPNTLMLFCLQISRAVEYLHSLNAVHCDLAARNVLVFSQDCVKLSDFGMCCFLPSTKVHKIVNDRKMPIKWMSPESLRHHIFTKATDVWMLGVCLWEVWMRGAVKPFNDIENSDVLLHIDAGHGLSQPEECPDFFYSVLERCWYHNHEFRSTSAELVKSFEQHFSSIEDTHQLGESTNLKRSEKLNALNYTPSKVTSEIAPNINSVPSYASVFLSNNTINNVELEIKTSLHAETPVMLDSALSDLYASIINLTSNFSEDSLDKIESSLDVYLTLVNRFSVVASNDLANQDIYMTRCMLNLMAHRLSVIGESPDDSTIDRAICLVSEIGTSAGLLYKKLRECSVLEMSSDV